MSSAPSWLSCWVWTWLQTWLSQNWQISCKSFRFWLWEVQLILLPFKSKKRCFECLGKQNVQVRPDCRNPERKLSSSETKNFSTRVFEFSLLYSTTRLGRNEGFAWLSTRQLLSLSWSLSKFQVFYSKAWQSQKTDDDVLSQPIGMMQVLNSWRRKTNYKNNTTWTCAVMERRVFERTCKITGVTRWCNFGY